jgi:peptidoglycan/xylan/chitin deacetylase (PgdA/CDA1 family)
VGTSDQASNARFILSFDCEGKWGMADDPAMASNNPIGHKSLVKAYARIFEILERYEVPATFALVGVFAGGYEEYVESRNELLESKPHRSWLQIPEQSFTAGVKDGWFYPELVQHIRSKGIHEIASHSYSHLPMNNQDVTRSSFSTELNLVQQWSAKNSIELGTFIFPRNQIQYPEELNNFGYLGYRQCDLQNAAYANRLKILQDECNIRKTSDAHSTLVKPIAIPPGTFLNWRHGPRRVIPEQLTLKRWSNVLQHAIAVGGVAHLWLHPHNLVTAKGQDRLFERAISMVAAMHKKDLLLPVTQKQYCEGLSRVWDPNVR